MSKKHSDDQKFAIDQFGEFIESSSQVLIISGSAGTGKTSFPFGNDLHFHLTRIHIIF